MSGCEIPLFIFVLFFRFFEVASLKVESILMLYTKVNVSMKEVSYIAVEFPEKVGDSSCVKLLWPNRNNAYFCPVTALLWWLNIIDELGIKKGPLFPSDAALATHMKGGGAMPDCFDEVINYNSFSKDFTLRANNYKSPHADAVESTFNTHSMRIIAIYHAIFRGAPESTLKLAARMKGADTLDRYKKGADAVKCMYDCNGAPYKMFLDGPEWRSPHLVRTDVALNAVSVTRVSLIMMEQVFAEKWAVAAAVDVRDKKSIAATAIAFKNTRVALQQFHSSLVTVATLVRRVSGESTIRGDTLALMAPVLSQMSDVCALLGARGAGDGITIPEEVLRLFSPSVTSEPATGDASGVGGRTAAGAGTSGSGRGAGDSDGSVVATDAPRHFGAVGGLVVLTRCKKHCGSTAVCSSAYDDWRIQKMKEFRNASNVEDQLSILEAIVDKEAAYMPYLLAEDGSRDPSAHVDQAARNWASSYKPLWKCFAIHCTKRSDVFKEKHGSGKIVATKFKECLCSSGV